MPLASQLTRDIPPLLPTASTAEAAAAMTARSDDALPVVFDMTSRQPAGVVRRGDIDACRAAGHDPHTCPVRNHLSRAYLIARPDDAVDFAEPARPGAPDVALVTGEDGRLLGMIVAPRGSTLTVTPAHKIEPMVGGMQGMELIWRCGDCGYVVHRPASPPDRCPDCDAPREHFFLVTED
jgi:hypothetical protein